MGFTKWEVSLQLCSRKTGNYAIMKPKVDLPETYPWMSSTETIALTGRE